MQKLGQLVRLKNTTQFFEKVILTPTEFKRLVFARVALAWLREVVVNYNELEYLFEEVKNEAIAKNKNEAFEMIVQSTDKNMLKKDVIFFSKGDLSLQDLSIMYGVFHKDVKKLAIRLLGEDFINGLWKESKKHRQKKTTEMLYGVSHTSVIPEVAAKRMKTTVERYGVTNAMKNEAVKKKCQLSNLKNNGHMYACQKVNEERWRTDFVSLLSADEKWLKVLNHQDFSTPHHRDFALGDVNTTVLPIFELYVQLNGEKVHYPHDVIFSPRIKFDKKYIKDLSDKGLVDAAIEFNSKSDFEIKILKYLDELDVDYVENTRSQLGGLEIDFYIPSLKVGIEVNPTYTHSSNQYALDRCMRNQSKDKYYHYSKYELAKQKGIKLIQLYEWDLRGDTWVNITKPRLKSLTLGYDNRYYARKCDFKVETSKKRIEKCRDFLNTYHTQGCGRANGYLSIYSDKLLIGVASVVKHKKNIELKRMCFLPGVQVVGGLSKVIRMFMEMYPGFDLMSYSDNNLGDGLSYKAAGGEFIRETGPSKLFVNLFDSTDRYSWMIDTPWSGKSGVLSQLGYDGSMSTLEFIETKMKTRNGLKEGYNTVYTAGSKLWYFENNI